jgi:peptidoglycan/xylan/chitin deacetylase (PgdA/CDA1 family)
MLSIEFPDSFRAERCWITSVLLGEFLGLVYEIRFHGTHHVRMSAVGKTLELSDVFFPGAEGNWLCRESLPAEPLRRWAVTDSGLDPALVEPIVPVLFGAADFDIDANEHATLTLDVFGSAFYMLSRYEEAACEQRDVHDRFPAAASLAYREGFVERPIVDEYVEILWTAMKRLWPQLKRKPRQFSTLVSCDVDHPYHPSAVSFPRLIKRTAGEAIRKRTFWDAVNPLRNYVASRSGNWQNDPYYYTVDWMMDVNEKAGNTAAFYFIPEITHPVMDDTCSITDRAVRAMMRRIAHRGHEIGIHPGYGTYHNVKKIISGKSRLQHVLNEERIAQRIMGGRQHYLRWTTRTPALWDAAGFEYDSTLGYADHAGFRCGTCHEYQMYDLHRRRALQLRQRPLICMECSVTIYMGCGFTDFAFAKMIKLKSAAQRFNGNFTLSWHNSYLETEIAREIYREVIA